MFNGNVTPEDARLIRASLAASPDPIEAQESLHLPPGIIELSGTHWYPPFSTSSPR